MLLLWGRHLQAPLLQVPVGPAYQLSVKTTLNQVIVETSLVAPNAPLIRPESGICTGKNVFQLRTEFIQFNGKPGEAVVQLIVCGHGAWRGRKHKTEKSAKFDIVDFREFSITNIVWNVGECGWRFSAYLASTCIWQKVGHHSKGPHAISQRACGSLSLLGPWWILEPRSH